MKIEARLRERNREMHLAREGGLYRGRIGEREFSAEIRDEGKGALTVRTGGRTFEVTYWRDGDALHLDLGEGTIAVEILDPLRPQGARAEERELGGRQEIRAAMPGKVVAVKVLPGGDVLEGQGVVVVEAMKMENEVLSPRAGRVTTMEVSPGQTVEKGALLFSIE